MSASWEGKKPVAEATLWFAGGTDPRLLIDTEGTTGFDLYLVFGIRLFGV